MVCSGLGIGVARNIGPWVVMAGPCFPEVPFTEETVAEPWWAAAPSAEVVVQTVSARVDLGGEQSNVSEI